MANPKLVRMQEFVDPKTGISHKQTITSFSLTLNGNYEHQIGGNGAWYPKESKQDQVTKYVPAPSIDELEEAAKQFPWFAPLAAEFMEKISAPFRGATETK